MTKTYVELTAWLRSMLTREDRGASLVEYALLVALIAIVCIAALQFVGTETNSAYNGVGSSLQG